MGMFAFNRAKRQAAEKAAQAAQVQLTDEEIQAKIDADLLAAEEAAKASQTEAPPQAPVSEEAPPVENTEEPKPKKGKK